jgi:NitT/TauT family transport system permease protein
VKRIQAVVPPLALGVVLLSCWQGGLFHKLFHVSTIQLPLPSQIVRALIGHFPAILSDAATTIGPALLGLTIGALLGYGAAIFVTLLPNAGYGFLLFVMIVESVPIVALAPLMNRWFTVPFLTKLAVVIVASSGSMVVNAYAGLNGADPRQLDLMTSLAATRREILWKLQMPGSLPSVFAALKIGVSSAMMATIISEFFSKETSGLGYMIKHSLKVGNQKQLGWAYIVAVSFLCILLYAGVVFAEHHVLAWHASQIKNH